MFKPLALFVGLRYLCAKRKNHFISFISASSIIGLALGVCVLIIVLSVMNGFDRALQHRILGMVPNATVTAAKGELANWRDIVAQATQFKGIQAAAPFISTPGMLTHAGNIHGTMVYGVDPAYEKKISIITQHMISGKISDLKPTEFSIILGSLLAQSLDAQIGDYVTLLIPQAEVNIAGVFPRFKRFKVIGIFSVGAQLDANLAYIDLHDAASLMRIHSGASGIQLKMDDLFKAPEIAWQFALTLPGNYAVQDWTQTQGQLFQAIKMEKTMVGLLLTLIVAVAAFNIVSTLVMVVTDKQSDIAILRTLGASPKTILMIFIVQGLFIGLIGTTIGIILGILGALNISSIINWIQMIFHVQFLNPNVYFISYLPSHLELSDVIMIGSISLIMSLLATIYPAWRASKIQPAVALRYE